MPVLTYPDSLPAAVGGQFSEGVLETKVRDQGDVGAPRQRNRFTRMLKRFSFQLQLTEQQKDVLAAFYDVELVRGVQMFNWTHPTSGVVYLATMPGRPAIQHMTAHIWTADVSIEEV